MPYSSPFDGCDCIKITFNVDFIETLIREQYEDYDDYGGSDLAPVVLLKEDIPDEDWFEYTTAIETAFNAVIRNPCHSFPNFSEWWLDNHTDATYEVGKAYDNLFYDQATIYAAREITDWYANIIAKRRINAAKKISEWWLDCNYNPKYKYCRDKVWKQHQEICVE
jgi:hypothetical protein